MAQTLAMLLEVFGEQQFKYETGEFKLKADRINKLTANSDNDSDRQPENRKVKIVACYKPGCLKKGGSKLVSVLEGVLRDRGAVRAGERAFRITVSSSSVLGHQLPSRCPTPELFWIDKLY